MKNKNWVEIYLKNLRTIFVDFKSMLTKSKFFQSFLELTWQLVLDRSQALTRISLFQRQQDR